MQLTFTRAIRDAAAAETENRPCPMRAEAIICIIISRVVIRALGATIMSAAASVYSVIIIAEVLRPVLLAQLMLNNFSRNSEKKKM